MKSPHNSHNGAHAAVNRRDFLRYSSVAAALAAVPSWKAIAGPFEADKPELIPLDKKLDRAWVKSLRERGEPTVYRGAELEKIGMPVGGICAGQLYLGGDGRLSAHLRGVLRVDGRVHVARPVVVDDDALVPPRQRHLLRD